MWLPAATVASWCLPVRCRKLVGMHSTHAVHGSSERLCRLRVQSVYLEIRRPSSTMAVSLTRILHRNSWQAGTCPTSSTSVQQLPRLTLAHCTCTPQLTSRHSSRPAVRVFSRDAEFATQQLQGIIAELRADPALSPVLDDRKVAAAIKEIAADPSSLQKHAHNTKVMRVMQRLLGQDLAAREAAAFADAGTTPADLFTAMSADAELNSLLQNSTVRTAIAQIRANPQAGMAKWGSDPLVTRALDLLEAALGAAQGRAGGLGSVIDVVAEEVTHHHQQQQQHQQQSSIQEDGKILSSHRGLRKRGSIYR